MKLFKNLVILMFTIILLQNCTTPPPTPSEYIGDISTPPKQVEADLKYTNVFSPLDGKWEGTFSIYEDSIGQRPGLSQPKFANIEFSDLSLRLISEVEVVQTYTSESPYFQRVIIEDTYTDENGEIQVVKSSGVNKVQDGQLWCVVNKPDETVIHSGTKRDVSTLIWQRSQTEPLKIEYFVETVDEDFYKIVGWGYYGDDNPNLTPKTWFVADYFRAEN